MKLLLTSNGLCNKSITDALLDLAGKPFGELKLSFIPTAANVSSGDKSWLIDDLYNCKKLGFAKLTITDISALPMEMWRPRLEEADILLFGGGNTFHLMYWLDKSGLKDMLSEMLKNKIYVCISAGSMITCPELSLSNSERLYYPEGVGKYTNEKGLGLVEFLIRPHFNSSNFPEVNSKNLEEFSQKSGRTVYGIDDSSSIKVQGDKILVVSEGKWEKFN